MILFSDVCFTYSKGDNGALDHFNLEVKSGECVLLCGKSGCGKSTVCNLINGIIPHHVGGEYTGQVVVNSADTKDASVQKLSQTVGSVFQNPKSQFFHLNTTDEILFSCSNRGLKRSLMEQRLRETIELFGIQELEDRNIFELSGGEKQKIACASVYAGKPAVFVFDEPSANLDKGAIGDLKRILKGIKDKGHTIVIAEHRLFYLMDICDRVLYLDNGQLLKEYTIEQFRQLDEKTRKQMGLRSLIPVETAPERDETVRESCDLRIENLLYMYQNRTVLDISKYAFRKGGVVAVTGANGAGKSTLAKCLCGINKCKGVFMGGQKLKEKQRGKRFSLIMQDVNHQLFAETVLDELLLGADSDDKELRQKALELLEGLSLAEYAARHPLSLSGGQKQRLAVAVSIFECRDYIIFDEPTSGLDYIHMKAVARQIDKLKKKTKLILIITHDIELINLCCDAVIYMMDGMIQRYR